MCDLNTATLDEIADLPGISPQVACQAKLWAPYSSWNDLESYLDAGAEAVRALQAAGAVIGLPELCPAKSKASGMHTDSVHGRPEDLVSLLAQLARGYPPRGADLRRAPLVLLIPVKHL